MDSQECPHCYVRVFPDKQGICPSCRKNVNDFSGVEADRGTIVISPYAKVPDLCSLCGMPTDRRVMVEGWRAREIPGTPEETGCLSALGMMIQISFSPFLSFFRFLFFRQKAQEREFENLAISVPQCHDCSAETLRPIESLFESQSLRILVHRQFKDEYNRLNPTE